MPHTTTILESLTDDRGEPLGSLKVTTTAYRLRTWNPARGSAVLICPGGEVLAKARLAGDGWRLTGTGTPDPMRMNDLRRALSRLRTLPGEQPLGLGELTYQLSAALLERSTGKVWRLTTDGGATFYSTAGEVPLRDAVGRPGAVDFVLEDTLSSDAVFTDPRPGTRSSLTH